MRKLRVLRAAAYLLNSLIVSLPTVAAQGLDTNLLQNPGFEDGALHWTPIIGSAEPIPYGSASAPSTLVGATISGGGKLLIDNNSNNVVEQIVDLAQIAGTRLHVGGHFGAVGDGTDAARLVVRFLTGPEPGDMEILRHTLDWASLDQRNRETVLLKREEWLEIPDGTLAVAARIEFTNFFGGNRHGCADNLFLELVTDPGTPPAVPLATQLLSNPGFEDGWPGETAGSKSPLTPASTIGWEGDGSSTDVHAYGTPDVAPSLAVSTIVGGEGHVLSDASGNGAVVQVVDVRGNLAEGQFDAPGMIARLSAALGGVGTGTDRASVFLSFLDLDGGYITQQELSAITLDERNREDVVQLRADEWSVPPDTAFLEVRVLFVNDFGGDRVGIADNIELMLVAPSTPEPHATGEELLVNGSFEDGPLSGSPLSLHSTRGWLGAGSSSRVVGYGSVGENVPPGAFSAGNNLGGKLLRDLGGDGQLRQRIDLRGDSEGIQAGTAMLKTRAWLGGTGTATDSARVDVIFRDALLGQTGLIEALGPVTAEERGGLTTLLKREKQHDIPADACYVDLHIVFDNVSGGDNYGLADAVSAWLLGSGGPGGGGGGGGGIDPAVICGAKQLKTVGQLYKALLTCHSKQLKKPDAAALLACLAKAEAKFSVKFDKAGQQAAQKGSDCGFQGDAEATVDLALADCEWLVDAISAGVDPDDKADVQLRTKLLALSTTLITKWLNAEAKHYQKPDPAKLSVSKAAAQDKFMAGMAKALAKAAKKGVSYSGSNVADLLTGIDEFTETLTDALE